MEKHTGVVNQILSKEAESFTAKAQVVELRKDDKFFLGFIVEKSLYLPLSANAETISQIKNMATINRLEAGTHPLQNMPEKVSNSLGLPLNGRFDEYMCDASAIDNQTISVLHMYPVGHCQSQEMFIKGVFSSLEKRGVRISFGQDQE